MASSMLPSYLPFSLISNGIAISTPKPSPSFFFPPSNAYILRSPTKISASSPLSQPHPSTPESSDSSPLSETDENDPVKLAYARAKEYKKNGSAAKPAVQNDAAGCEERKSNEDADVDVPLSVKLALEKAREYKKNKGLAGSGGNAAEKQTISGTSRLLKSLIQNPDCQIACPNAFVAKPGNYRRR